MPQGLVERLRSIGASEEEKRLAHFTLRYAQEAAALPDRAAEARLLELDRNADLSVQRWNQYAI